MCLPYLPLLLTCSVIALKIDGSYQGSFGKHPATLCAELAECPAGLDPTCVLVPNTTLDKPAITVADLDTCSLSGIANGPVVPGFFAWNDTIPDGRCTAAQPCTGEGARCSYATGGKFCTCAYGTDTCVPLGECYVTSCSTCQDCLTKTNAFVATQLQSKDATAVAAAWRGFCSSKLLRATAADCQLSEAAIAASPYGNLGKRAASLCSWVKCEQWDCSCCRGRVVEHALLPWGSLGKAPLRSNVVENTSSTVIGFAASLTRLFVGRACCLCCCTCRLQLRHGL
jgi:hypothetical protein